jgi:hypothetical protein
VVVAAALRLSVRIVLVERGIDRNLDDALEVNRHG